MNTKTQLVSFHGGHSGQFCSHAKDMLEDFILRYIKLGFSKVGISEHAPPVNDKFLFPEEKKAGLNAKTLYKRFEDYFQTIRALQKKYRSKIKIFAGFETETCTGYLEHTKKMIAQFMPDYIVGSVHHIDDKKALNKCGSYESMYEKYFDMQYEMIKALSPFVIGHFDLIRIYDDDYKKRLLSPEIKKKTHRNLKLIKEKNLVLDFNLRPLCKKKTEPYIDKSILTQAKKLNLLLVPGDDSHKKDQAGLYVGWAVKTLEENGFNTKFPEPILLT